MRSITALTLVATLALGACGSDDDDGAVPTTDGATTDPSGVDPATSGPAPGADETSMPAPGVGPDASPSSAPGGPTPLVAGLWDASDDGAPVSDDYVDIADDGLWTRYTLDEAGGNCFDVDGPYTLMLEIADTDEYSLSSEDEGLTLAVSGDSLTYRLGRDGEVENWERAADGATVGSLGLDTQVCDAG